MVTCFYSIERHEQKHHELDGKAKVMYILFNIGIIIL